LLLGIFSVDVFDHKLIFSALGAAHATNKNSKAPAQRATNKVKLAAMMQTSPAQRFFYPAKQAQSRFFS